MPIDFQRLYTLRDKYNNQACSEKELKELDELLEVNWQLLNSNDIEQDKVDWERMYRQIISKSQTPVVHFFRRRLRIIAAACILGVLGIAGLLYRNGLQQKTTKVIAKDIVAPDRNRATITLAGGNTVRLADVDTGIVATQEHVQIKKMNDGQITYAGSTASQLYNTLHNPRGSRVVEITLGDGTRAWLNAASSLSYPAAFAAGSRKVEVEGEVYFEVAHDVMKPFVVATGSTSIIVLGTRFNINTFDDNGSPAKVTLLQGRVKVVRGADSAVLKPLEQAQVRDSSFTVIRGVDGSAVLAWKTGLFNFEQVDLKTVLAELSRWYDIDIAYEGNVASRVFHGKMSRELSLTQVLIILKEMDVKFRMEGRKLVVTQ